MDGKDRAFVHPRRLAAFAFAIVGAFTVLGVRLWDLQVANGDRYRALAEQNRLVRIPIVPSRGEIVDRNGYVLARNDPGFAIVVTPIELPRAREDEVVSRLAPIVGRGSDEIAKVLVAARERNPYEAVRVNDRPLARENALLVIERAELYPGVNVTSDPVRVYPDGPLYSPIVGYIGSINAEEYAERKRAGYLLQDTLGKTGLEWRYEEWLRGKLGWREIERDAAQRQLRTLSVIPPTPGNDIVLTIDSRLQRILRGELEEGVAAGRFSQGVGVAMNPQNGEILAMVSVPAYDNNAFVRGVSQAQMDAWNADPRRPLVNKAIGDIYPPGSTFKLVTGLAALTTGVATRNTVVNVSSNVLVVDGWRFYDWRAHGRLDFMRGFTVSSDIYFYTMGGGNPYTGQRGAGPEAIAKYGKMLGFGAPTGIDLPGEAGGIMPDPAWKLATFDEPWTLGNTYQESIGQGFVAVTPLQLLNAYAAVANGGTLYRPRLLKEVRSSDGGVVYRSAPQVLRKLDMRADDLRTMREAARSVVTSGYAPMRDAKLPIAGKTGTAEFGESKGVDASGRNELSFHNWFVSFLPKADNADPTAEIAMVVFTFDSSRCGQCPNPAVGLTQEVLEAYVLGDAKTAP